ncbi:Transcriptional regulator [Gammaproteobacteria bacterium]
MEIHIEGPLLLGVSDAALKRATTAAIYALAEEYTEATRDYIDKEKPFTSRTGSLFQSIGWNPLGDASAEVYANSKLAAWVEFGTKPHIIAPKDRKALKIPSENGGFVFRKKVHHPGTKARPFFFGGSAKRQERVENAAFNAFSETLAEAI